MNDKIKIFVERLKKIGIEIELHGNYPWIYLHSVNGNIVKEKLHSEYAFTIAWMPIRNDQELRFIDEQYKIFEIIRKYYKMNRNKLIKEHTEILLGFESGEVISPKDPDFKRMKQIEKELNK